MTAGQARFLVLFIGLVALSYTDTALGVWLRTFAVIVNGR